MNFKADSRNCHKLILRILPLLVFCQIGIGQDCLRPSSDEDRQIPFQYHQDLPRLPRNTLALIPDYQFYCYGNITNWQVLVAPIDDNIIHVITLQVWRPDPANPNCFNLVGMMLLGESGSQISVQPGDVVGYNQGVFTLEGPNPNGEGIILDTSVDDVSVWYQTGSNFIFQSTISSICIPDDLNSVTMAAPAISMELDTPCLSPTTTDPNLPMSQPCITFTSTSSSQEPTATDLEAVTSQSISTIISHPSPSDENLKLLSLLTVLAVLGAMLVTLGGVIAVHRRKRAKTKADDRNDTDGASITAATSQSFDKKYLSLPHEKGVEMVDNTAYAHNISTKTNMCYALSHTHSSCEIFQMKDNTAYIHSQGIEMMDNAAYAHNMSTTANMSYVPSHVHSSCERFQMKDNTAYIRSDNSTVKKESCVATNIATSANPAYSKSLYDDTETSNVAEAEYSYPTNHMVIGR